MHTFRLACCLASLLLPAAAPAANRTVALDAGSVHEECLLLERGQTLRYAFHADRALAFNIHYHEGDAVHYPVRHTTAAARGEFAADVPQHYCMMWTNESGTATVVDYEFAIEAGS